jgi:hypothetical protein
MTICQLPIPSLMRPSVKRQAAADEGLLVDVFAGFGGASIALERAYGRAVDISIKIGRASCRERVYRGV